MTIYTYYDPVHDLDCEHELKLMLLWRARWTAAGFQPYVLSEWHAQQHPKFEEWSKFIDALPSVNPPGYERACWMRWLALAQMKGGMMSDYDVIPYGENVIELLRIPRTKTGVHLFQKACPSLVYADTDPLRFINDVMENKPGLRQINGKPHYSDMYAFEDLAERERPWLKLHDIVKSYGEPGWETAPFVHYNNGTMCPAAKTPRYQHIPALRP